MEYTKEQLEKLPKWAQRHIYCCERDIGALKKEKAETSGDLPTNTIRRDGLERIPLPNNSNIEFFTDSSRTQKATIYVRSNGLIDVNTDSGLGKKMVIIPNTSNSFYIAFVD